MSTGYLNRVIHLPFPDLGGVTDDDKAIVWVVIRNPRLLAGQEILGSTTVAIGDDGKPVDSAAAQQQTFGMIAKLALAGHVWDPTWTPPLDADGQPVDTDEEAPLIEFPLTAEKAALLPMPILNRIGEELKSINPQ